MEKPRLLFVKTLSVVFLGLLTSSAAYSQATSAQYLAAANQLYTAKNLPKAVQYYQAAIQLNPNDAASYQGLGNCYYGLGQKNQALNAYERSLSLNPGNTQLAAFIQNLRSQTAPTPTDDNSPIGNIGGPLAHQGIAASDPTSPPGAFTGTNSPVQNHDTGRNVWDVSVGGAFGNGGTGLALGSIYFFPLSGQFSIGIASNLYIFGATIPTPYGNVNDTTYITEALLMAKYTFEGKIIRPFLMAGGGLDVLISTTSGTASYYTSTDFSFGFYPGAAVGGGISLPLGAYSSFFVEGQLSIVFGGSTTNASIGQGGFNQSTTNSGTLTFIPLEAGFTFPI